MGKLIKMPGKLAKLKRKWERRRRENEFQKRKREHWVKLGPDFYMRERLIHE